MFGFSVQGQQNSEMVIALVSLLAEKGVVSEVEFDQMLARVRSEMQASGIKTSDQMAEPLDRLDATLARFRK